MMPCTMTSGIMSALAGSAVVLLGAGCLWPANHPPRATTRRSTPPPCTLRPMPFLAGWTCQPPLEPFTPDQADRCTQLHRGHDCPRKQAALDTLLAATPSSPDRTRARIREVVARAARLGYRLVRDYPIPYRWRLLDAEDGEPLYTADTLDEIESWLAT